MDTEEEIIREFDKEKRKKLEILENARERRYDFARKERGKR